jgi:hypothetical protein
VGKSYRFLNMSKNFEIVNLRNVPRLFHWMLRSRCLPRDIPLDQFVHGVLESRRPFLTLMSVLEICDDDVAEQLISSGSACECGAELQSSLRRLPIDSQTTQPLRGHEARLRMRWTTAIEHRNVRSCFKKKRETHHHQHPIQPAGFYLLVLLSPS